MMIITELTTNTPCPKCGRLLSLVLDETGNGTYTCKTCGFKDDPNAYSDPVNAPSHYTGKIECIDYLRDKLTKEEFTGFCMGNVLKYSSRWRKKDGLQDLKKAKVYLEWAIENEEKSDE